MRWLQIYLYSHAVIIVFFAFCSPSLASDKVDSGSQNIPAKMERDFIDGPFGQIHVRIVRPASQTSHRPLILLHPTPYSGDYFRSFIRLMAHDRLVIAIDTPGYGDSAAPEGLPTIKDYADAATVALDRLGLKSGRGGSVDVLGYHTGSLIAIELALQQPKLVRRLVLGGLPFYTGEEREKAYKRNAVPETINDDGSHLKNKWEFSSIAVPSGLPLARAQEHFNDSMQCYPSCWKAYHAVFSYESNKRIPLLSQPVMLITMAGSLKAETESARPLFRDSKIVHFAEITYGGFDLHTEKLIQTTRAFLDENNSK